MPTPPFHVLLKACLILIGFGSFLPLSLIAQQDSLPESRRLVLDSLEKSYDLEQEVEVWLSSDRSLIAEDVWDSDAFIPLASLQDSNFTDQDLWIRFTVKSSFKNASHWVLVDNGATEYLDLFWLGTDNSLNKLSTGSHLPGKDRALRKYNHLGIPIDLDSLEKRTYLLRARNTYSLELQPNLKLVPLRTWESNSQEKNLVFIFSFIGILTIMFLYSFMVFFGTREKTYLHYALYIASIAGFLLFAGGPHQLLVKPEFNIFGMFISLSGISIFYFQFGRSFLDTPTLIPSWDVWIKRYIWLRFALLIFQLAWLYFRREPETVVYIEFSFFLVDAVLTLGLYVILIRAKSTLARYFIVGSSVVFVFALSYIGITIVFLNKNPDFDLFFVAIIIEILVFALGLGYKMRKSEKDKLAAQAEKLEAQESLNQELSKINSAFGRFVPHEFLQSLGYDNILDIQLGDAVEREVTVFFSDIRDYTSLSEEMSPRENFHFLNAYLGRVGPVIKQYGGFVNQYYGDGIMAIFMDSPADAVQAAVEMRAVIHTYNQYRQEKGRKPIKVGIGLHTGPLMMGVIGDTLRMEAGVVSDTVNTAARMEGLTKHFHANIMASESTLKGSQNLNVHQRFLGRVQVKGRKEPLSVYEYYEGDKAEVLRLKNSTQKDFEEGLHFFYQQEFVEAAKCFDRVLAISAHDHPAQQYHKKATQLILEGVPKDWSGVDIILLK